MKIAVNMIVKNEEVLLGRCLESVKDFDAIYITDTGSTDRTVEIAKKYTDNISHFEWCDSFCKARNFAKKQVPSEYEWILTIDADEYLENTYEQVKEVLKQAKTDTVSIKVKAERTGVTHNFPKLYRNIPGIFWVNDVHNLLNKDSRNYSDLVVVYGYSPAHKKDPDRAMRILKKSIAKNPKSVRERYYLALEYWYRRWYKKCIEEIDRYLKVATYRAEMADAYLMKARCLWNTQKGEQARVSCMYAIMTNPDFKEALLFMSEMNYEPRKSKWMEYSNLAKNEDVLFVRTNTQKGAEYYDKLFENDTDMSRYEEIYKKIGGIVKDKKVLDIGCGLCELSKHVKNYKGFDIAKKTMGKKRKEGLDVWVGDALEGKNYKKVDFYVCLEVLEHITEDKKVLELVPGGSKIILSVPSFSDPSHVRYFNENSLRERYEDLIKIESIVYFVWDKEKKVWYESDKLSSPFILLVQATRL